MSKKNAYLSYEKIATWFDAHRSRDLFEKAWLDKALSLLPNAPTILDLGCGMGEPIIPYLLEKGSVVTGVDGSAKLVSLAKSRLPGVEFILCDMRDLDLKKQYDMVLAWHSFFHLSQDDQQKMFTVSASHLKLGGVLLFTSGEEEGEIWGENGGEQLYHASFSPEDYKELLTNHGFDVIDHKIDDPDCGDATVWLAQLKKDKGV